MDDYQRLMGEFARTVLPAPGSPTGIRNHAPVTHDVIASDENYAAYLRAGLLLVAGGSFEYGSFPLDRTPNPDRVQGTLWERVGERDADAEPFTPSPSNYAPRPGLGRRSTLDGWIHPPTTSHFCIRTYPRSAAHDLTAAR